MSFPSLFTHFLSCDWGTSRFRLRLIERESLTVVSEHLTDQGIQSLALAHPDPVAKQRALAAVLINSLAHLEVSDQSEIPLIISGMASSTLGWKALPYQRTPAPIDGSSLRFEDCLIANQRARLISGLRSESDVMRGEETEIVGIFAILENPALETDSVLILPGTHSKHVQIRQGQIIDFSTFLTGELYQLLRHHSTLQTNQPTHFDPEAFSEGVRVSRERGMSAALFQTRARSLLGKLPIAQSSAFLSGILIGAEIDALAAHPPAQVILAAGDQLAIPYRIAIDMLLPQSTVTQLTADELAAASIHAHVKILARP